MPFVFCLPRKHHFILKVLKKKGNIVDYLGVSCTFYRMRCHYLISYMDEQLKMKLFYHYV